MSSKKIHNNGEEAEQTPENNPERMARPATEGFGQASVDPGALVELENQLDAAQAQAAEYKDGWQRSVAEFQNYRRRLEAEKAETYQSAVGSIIKRYLPVLDDMERAMQARPAGLAWAKTHYAIRNN